MCYTPSQSEIDSYLREKAAKELEFEHKRQVELSEREKEREKLIKLVEEFPEENLWNTGITIGITILAAIANVRIIVELNAGDACQDYAHLMYGILDYLLFIISDSFLLYKTDQGVTIITRFDGLIRFDTVICMILSIASVFISLGCGRYISRKIKKSQ